MADTVGKYLVFALDMERYGIPIAKVREVMQFVPVTPVHEASSHLRGVINLRGRIIPIIDMRAKFGITQKDYSERTLFIIVEIAGVRDTVHIGMAVDAVHDVVEIPESNLERTPDIGLRLKSQYLTGIARVQDQMLMVLNIDRLMQTDEVVELTSGLEATGAAHPL